MKRPWFSTLLLLFLPLTALAQDGKPLYPSDLKSTLPGTKKSYLQLIRQIIPDLHIDPKDADVAIAQKTIPFKHLADKTPAAALEGDIKLDSFVPQWIKSDGRRVLLLELNLSSDEANQGTNYQGEADVIGAFAVEPEIKLLDVMDMKTDRFSGFWEKPSIFSLNSQHDAFVVSSSHWNSGENYTDLTVLFLNHNRFEVITNVFLFDTQGCGATLSETPSFRAVPGKNRYPSVVVTIRVKKDADSEDCDRRTGAYVKVYRALYEWNASKREYRTTSKELMALDRFNQKRL